MNRLWLVGLFLVGIVAVGCSSSDSVESCGTAADGSRIWCAAGMICLDGGCRAVECISHADCETLPGKYEFCAVGIDPLQPDKGFCTEVMCANNADCIGMTDKFGASLSECNLAIRRCIPGQGQLDVVVEPDNPGGGDKDGLDSDTPPVSGDGSVCVACTTNADCSDGTKCLPLGGGTFCFANCETNDDCAGGWTCYALSNDGRQCVPASFNCDAACLTAGCADGFVCNQLSGECGIGGDSCKPCQYDWNCAKGYRCYTANSYCAPECGTGCPGSSSCQTVNAQPVNLCISQAPTCCYGDNCSDQCPAEKPHIKGGVCVQCLNDGHCGAGEKCSVAGSCTSSNCPDPNLPYDKNGTCVQCLNDNHCVGFGTVEEPYKCKVPGNTCTPDILPPECQYCATPYPACIQLGGVWSCVQCASDADCPGGTCDTSLYTCTGGPPPGCTGCQNDGQCTSFTGLDLKCHPGSGCCYDTAGWCDGVEALCPGGGQCKGLMDILMGGMGGMPGLPGMPTEGSFGACTCTQPMDMMGLLPCLMGACASSECFGNAVCLDPSLLGTLLGGVPSGGGEGYCINLSSILGGLF